MLPMTSTVICLAVSPGREGDGAAGGQVVVAGNGGGGAVGRGKCHANGVGTRQLRDGEDEIGQPDVPFQMRYVLDAERAEVHLERIGGDAVGNDAATA